MRTRRTSFVGPDWTIARASPASMTMPTNVTLGGSGGGGGGLGGGGGGGAGARRLGENSGRSRVAERRSSECTASGLARPAGGGGGGRGWKCGRGCGLGVGGGCGLGVGF